MFPFFRALWRAKTIVFHQKNHLRRETGGRGKPPIFRRWLLAFFLALASPLAAAPAQVVTFDSIPARIRSQNPELAAARLRIDEAAARASGSGRMENPRLETSLEHNPRFREGAIEIGISQKFPMTDKLRREREISAAEIRTAELEVKQKAQSLAAEARAALVEILAIREQRAVLARQTSLNNELARSISDAALKGEGSVLDAGQARVETMQAAAETRQLDAKEAVLLASLKQLLGLRPQSSLVVSGLLGPAEIPGIAGDPSRRGEYQIAATEAEIAAKSIGLAQAKRREDWEAAAFVSGERAEDAPGGVENEAMVGVRLSIPLPFWNKNEAPVREAIATHERKRRETKAVAAKILGEADGARAEMIEWRKLIREIDRDLLPLAAKQAADTEKAWRNGQADFQTVLKSRAQRLNLEVSRVNALRDFHLARARHLAALGR